MTISDSSSSDKKVYVECISSEVYLTVSPERRHILKDLINGGNGNYKINEYYGNGIFRYSCGTSYGMQRALDNDIKQFLNKKYKTVDTDVIVYIPSYLKVRVTCLELLDLLDRANKLILDTEEGIRSAINKIIDTDTKRGIQPGTLRFFSNDLICYYTGKNWKKIERLP